MKILSINLKPSIIPSSFTEGKQIIEGHVTVDQIPNINSLIRIELEVLPLAPPAVIGGSSSVYYSQRVELKTSKLFYIPSFSIVDESPEIPLEDIHRFSGFLDN